MSAIQQFDVFALIKRQVCNDTVKSERRRVVPLLLKFTDISITSFVSMVCLSFTLRNVVYAGVRRIDTAEYWNKLRPQGEPNGDRHGVADKGLSPVLCKSAKAGHVWVATASSSLARRNRRGTSKYSVSLLVETPLIYIDVRGRLVCTAILSLEEQSEKMYHS
jgi:hypothetical protein